MRVPFFFFFVFSFFPGGRNLRFILLMIVAGFVCLFVCLFVWEWWWWWWWLGLRVLSSWCACEVLYLVRVKEGCLRCEAVARRRILLLGSRDLEELLVCYHYRSCGDSHGFVAVSETEIITAKGHVVCMDAERKICAGYN